MEMKPEASHHSVEVKLTLRGYKRVTHSDGKGHKFWNQRQHHLAAWLSHTITDIFWGRQAKSWSLWRYQEFQVSSQFIFTRFIIRSSHNKTKVYFLGYSKPTTAEYMELAQSGTIAEVLPQMYSPTQTKSSSNASTYLSSNHTYLCSCTSINKYFILERTFTSHFKKSNIKCFYYLVHDHNNSVVHYKP